MYIISRLDKADEARENSDLYFAGLQ